MISKKNYTLLSLIFLPLFTYTQEIDPMLLSQLSPDQVEAFKEAVELKKIEVLEGEDLPITEETLVKIEVEDELAVSKKFGYDFFSSMPTSLSAVGDLPFPNDYKISLRDQFRVILTGSKDQIYSLNVNLDGTILFPELGSVYVAGLDFQEVKDKLSNMIDQAYIGVEIDISLQNLSAKKVTIVGAVKTPGTYLINPFSTITGALAYSGGISEIGSLRNIKLIRNNGSVFSFDLYDLLIRGDRSNDLTLEAGDTILIGAAIQFVEIRGSVNRPAIYEILEDEKIIDIVDFALGFKQTANKSNIAISYLDLDKAAVTSQTDVELDQSLKNVLFVDIFDYVSDSNININVSGAVEEPGFYDLEKYNNLNDLIEDLRFVDVYPWLAVLEQFDDDNLVQSTVLFNLDDKSTYQSIKLFPNSKLFFANIDERSFDVGEEALNKIDQYALTLNFNNEVYSIPVIGEYTVKSFIDLLGLDMTDVSAEATYINPLESIVITDDFRKMSFISKKYQNISFRSPVNDLISVNISGAIDFPGSYTLKSDSSLQDLYNLVGGFKDAAFLEGVILKREAVAERQLKAIETSEDALNKSILVSLQQGEDLGDFSIFSALADSIEPENLGRIAGDFSPLSKSLTKTTLFDGDTIIIPKKTNVVNIIGSVLNPLAFELDEKISIEDAIKIAGGYQSYADKRRVYVIRANGLIEKSARNVFSGSFKLSPGDTVVVPRKVTTDSPIIRSLLPVMQILSDLSFSAAALDNLTSN
tara:strand:+ start:4923 stop:7187 length:2265 start_codon:yes stop_codon:yes gene_type:complete